MSKIFTITEGLENMGALRTGGQGSVYKGRRTGSIISAVKVLPTPIYAEDENDKNFRSFLSEVEKLKKVNEDPNPNVVKILNSGLTESGSLPFIEMEYIEGPDLEDLLKPPHAKIFTIKEVIKLADHLANALAHCHRAGVKHGDIKSNNVKYNIHSGNYVLLDFGLAIMSDEQRRTSIRHAGAIEFMAPEQNTGVMLLQTDIYSFGIIIYELLGGQVPFPLHDSGETARNTVMVAHMESPVPDLQQLRKNNLPDDWPEIKQEHETFIPRWLLEIVNRCLEKDPEKRFSNGMALQEAVLNGSLYTDVSENSILALQQENEQLKASLKQVQEDAQNQQSFIQIPKGVFMGSLGLIFLALAFATYGILKKPTPTLSTQPDSTRSAVIKPVAVKPSADSLRKAAIIKKTQLHNDSLAAARKKRMLLAAKKKKHHVRKKFLGIF
ncbi:MAG: serine/threonine protein kinase [Mucilaginibacter sp.]